MEENTEIKKEPQIFVEKLHFNDGHEMSLGHSDIVIFTGANNAGKSQVLKDIDMHLENIGKNGVVLTSMDIEFVGDISVRTKDFLNKDGKYQIGGNIFHEFTSIEDLWNRKDRRFVIPNKNRLNTESRLNASKTAPSFNAQNEKPSSPVQKLYDDDKLEEKISNLFHEAFNEYLILNIRGGNQIPIHVGQPPKKEAGEERSSTSYTKKLCKLPILENQGDGMRSFAGILFDVFTSHKTITMIDEPEAFLHPPQARLLGRMLVKNKPNDRQFFISTHSEDFLKGLLDADSENVRIVRIERDGDVNNIKELDNNGVKKLWKDSILRYSNILSGLFHSKVVICESDTDCRFYQAILNALYEGKDLVSPDILFTHCGGKERLKTVIPALRELNVKTVVVADIDVLNNEDTFKTICDKMGITWDLIKAKWKSITEFVKNQKAQLETDEVRKEIKKIFDSVTTKQLSNDDIDAIKAKLKASTAWSLVKQVGMNFFHGQQYTDLEELMDLCQEKGLFVVPVGELEYFYRPLASNSTHGTKWVNGVMEKDLANDKNLEDARKFVKEIDEYK